MTGERFWCGGRMAGMAVAAVVAASGVVRADDLDDCANPIAQQEMNRCAERDYEAADRELNTTYRQVIARQNAGGRVSLVAAERTWIANRDKTCKDEAAENEGGSIYPLVYNGCLTRLTKARIGWLRLKLTAH